jgi:pimeloyl-ACP methyl ester carboxylesterase
MAGRHRIVFGLATSTGILGLTVTSGLAMVAHRLVDEFSRPHQHLHDATLTWGLPPTFEEPARACQRSLLFHTADGVLLCGDFWAQPRPAPTVVLCHGYRISRSYLRAAAALEYGFGYNVLLFDFRGHGDSDSVMTSAGNAEVRDLEAALVVARRQPETLPGRIIIHGFSMGAAVSLLASPHPDVVAIIADSPYARSDDIIRRVIHYMFMQASNKGPFLRPLRYLTPPLSWIIMIACTIVFRLRYGFGVVARPDSSFKRWKARAKKVLQQHSIPILLIHGEEDTFIPIEHARMVASAATAYNVPLETYFVKGAGHCGAYLTDPQGYLLTIQQFLMRYLGDDFPEQHRQI